MIRPMSPSQNVAAVFSTPASSRRTYFTGEEVQKPGFAGTWITDGNKLYISDAVLSGDDTATDPRVAGQATMHLSAIWDPANYTGLMWGDFRLENGEGEWIGYWQGKKVLSGRHVITSIIATARGGGSYEGLVTRWTYSGEDVDLTHKVSISGLGGVGKSPIRNRQTRVLHYGSCDRRCRSV